jgi:hypothetical protein
MSFLKRISNAVDKKLGFPDFIPFLVTGFCFGWFCFLAGVWFNQFGRTPFIDKAFNSTYALAYETYNRVFKPETYASKSTFWVPSRYEQQGAITYLTDQVSGELTLLLSAHHQGAELIDLKGELVHQWNYAYEKTLAKKISAGYFYWWKAHLYPNGDLLAIVNLDSKTPAGMTLIKLDKNSKLIWEYQAPVHHDFFVDEQGLIYILKQSIRKKVSGELANLVTPFIDEHILVLNQKGEALLEMNLFDLIAESAYKKVLKRIPKNIKGDYLHSNSIRFISEKEAKLAPYLKPNSVLVSIREIDAVVAIDMENQKLYWMERGPWFFQHDADFLANGNLMVFDNRSLGRQSRVLEYNPMTKKEVWDYKGSDKKPLYSIIRGNQQPLSNGNVLIVESNGSRLLEVNRDKQIIWEYYSPVREQDFSGGIKYSPVFMHAERIYAKDLGWLIKH